ncbi:MAG: hypothetical protein HYU41_06690 [Candidatus Rokubacteria bacterium]|nr:hypothetical protein [Candidatus Rokubacteria bacterium]
MALVVLAFVAAFFIDEPLRRSMEREVNNRLQGYTAKIAGLDFHPIGFSLDLESVTLHQDAHPDPPVATFPNITASVQWRALLRGALVADFRFDRPKLHVNRQHLLTEAKDDVPIDERGWQHALAAVYPLKINEFRVIDGEVVMNLIQNAFFKAIRPGFERTARGGRVPREARADRSSRPRVSLSAVRLASSRARLGESGEGAMAASGETDVVVRLEALEHRHRRLVRAGSVLLLGVVAVALIAQAPAPPPSRTVEAETFILRDRAGRARAALSVGIDDRPGLALADTRQKIRAWMTLSPDGAPELRFYDADETLRSSLTLDTAGTPRFVLAEKSGKARARFELSTDGSPAFALLDKTEKPRAVLSVDAADVALVRLTDAEARAQATMGVRAFGLPAFTLTGRDGKVVWKAP